MGGWRIHVPLKNNSNNFDDCLTFHLAPSSGLNLNLSNAFIDNYLPANLTTFPASSAVLCVQS